MGVNLDSFSQGDREHPQGELCGKENPLIHLSLLSYLAFQLEKKVPRAHHFKGNVQYEQAFTGKDIVVSTREEIIFILENANRAEVDNPCPTSERVDSNSWPLYH